MTRNEFKKEQRNVQLALVLLGAIIGIVVMLVIPKLGLSGKTNTGLVGPIKYNCELSDGTFKNGKCTCHIESFQTQEEMYDKDTGFCQTTFGGPGGNAFAASIGLPYGEYQYWNSIMSGLCDRSGGNMSGAACICSPGKDYDKTTGQCK